MAKGGEGKVSNGLVAASFAAVLAVYTAGYSRTQEAALRLEAKHQERRPARTPQATAVVSPPPTPAESAEQVPEQPTAPTEQSAHRAEAPATSVAAESVPEAIVSKGANPEPSPAETTAAKAPAAPVEATVAPAATPSAVSAQTQATTAPAPTPKPATNNVATSAAAPAVSVPAPTPEPAAPPKPKWADGEYWGWGTSRHGDIEAHVVIKDGRIVDAGISTCETRYPCDVIAQIIKQPIQRQSADVDYVSRATESADAYYYGLVEALRVASKLANSGK